MIDMSKTAEELYQDGRGDYFDDVYFAQQHATRTHCTVVENGGVYFVPNSNDYDGEGNPREGSLDWALNNGWSLSEVPS